MIKKILIMMYTEMSFCFAFAVQDFPGGKESAYKKKKNKESACNAGNLGSIPGWVDPLEKEMANHSTTLAWEIP